MGCSDSIERRIPPEWYQQFVALKMTKSEMAKLLRVYKKIDVDGSGTVDLPELFVFLNIEHTPFTERVFNIFDMNGTGKVDFREFVLSLWNYCTLSKATLDIFTFDLYDADASGILSHQEVVSMLTDIYGHKMKNNPNAQAVMQELHKMEQTGPFTLEKFTKFTKHHHNMLFPAFQLQLHLQEHILGVSFWTRCSNRRVELSKGKFVTMGELMQLHVHEDLYNKFVRDSSMYGRRAQSKAKLVLENTGTLQHRHQQEQERNSHHSDAHAPERSYRGGQNNHHGHGPGHRNNNHGHNNDDNDRPSARIRPKQDGGGYNNGHNGHGGANGANNGNHNHHNHHNAVAIKG